MITRSHKMDLRSTIQLQDCWLTKTLSAACLFALITIHFYYKHHHSFWTKKGVKGPRPLPIVGNVWAILFGDRMRDEIEWPQKYGKVYGIYQGKEPVLVIADPEVIHQVCVKDFDAFANHTKGEFLNKYQKAFLFFMQDDHWKRVRALMSPTFTSGKIKRMFKFLNGCANDLTQSFMEHIEPGSQTDYAIVNLKELYNLYAMDAITTCCYGLKLERAGSKSLKMAATRNELVAQAMKLFHFSYLRFFVSMMVPKFLLRLFQFELVASEHYSQLAATTRRLIASRRQSAKKFEDYLQLLIDAKLGDRMDLDELDEMENHHAGLTRESLLRDQTNIVAQVGSESEALGVGQQQAGSASDGISQTTITTYNKSSTLTDMEVVGLSMVLLAVGLDTTGTTLANCTYALAFHQDVQERLYGELLKIAEYDEDKSEFTFDYEALTSCKYLDAVVSETQRRLTPVLALERYASRDYRIEKYNIDIPAGTCVSIAYYAVSNNPDYWESPEKFNPERFMPGNREKIVPGSYCPFGLGPRHCIGMRFSLTETKLALAKISTAFQLVPAPNTAFPPKVTRGPGLVHPSDPRVKVIPRGSHPPATKQAPMMSAAHQNPTQSRGESQSKGKLVSA